LTSYFGKKRKKTNEGGGKEGKKRSPRTKGKRNKNKRYCIRPRTSKNFRSLFVKEREQKKGFQESSWEKNRVMWEHTGTPFHEKITMHEKGKSTLRGPTEDTSLWQPTLGVSSGKLHKTPGTGKRTSRE